MSLTPPTPPTPAESTDPAASTPAPADPPPDPASPVSGPASPAAAPAVPVPDSAAPVSDSAAPVPDSAALVSGLAATDGSVGGVEPARRGARQLSLFGVEAAEPATGDLAGLLAGPGEVVRMGGTARVSVCVDAAWRVHVLVAELARRGLTASWIGSVAEQQHGVRTSYTTRLAALSTSWLRGTVKRPPAGFFLNGPRLRLWAAAAGRSEPLGFVLGLGPADEGCWEAVGAALAAIGLPAVLLDPGAGGPGYRITGRRRLARLAELVGDRPPAAPPAQWPAGRRDHDQPGSRDHGQPGPRDQARSEGSPRRSSDRSVSHPGQLSSDLFG